MSDKAQSREEIEFLINGNALKNKLQYVWDHAVTGDQVIQILQIRNRVLIAWEKLKFNDCEKNYVELLNNLVGNGIAKFKTNSKRLLSRIKVECSKQRESYRSPEKRNKKNSEGFLNSWTKLSILRSDVMTVGDLEEENRRLQRKAQEQEDRIKRLNYDIEEWKQNLKTWKRRKKHYTWK